MKNKFLLGLLALLGFSGCEFLTDDGDGDDGGGVLMYGPVRIGFVVKGAVTDAGEKPLEGIRVVLKVHDEFETDDYAKSARDTVYTDEKGGFETTRVPENPLLWTLIAEDIDGPENGGEFESRSEDFRINESLDFEEGRLVKRIDFTLTEKEESDESE
jgi:putative lipoprotein (rSAM/lipoprotein system)